MNKIEKLVTATLVLGGSALAVLLALSFGDMKSKPETSQKVNAEFTVDTLFTKDGCTVYRFKDGGNSRYFTNCKGSTSWTQSCGRNCVRQVEIPGGAN